MLIYRLENAEGIGPFRQYPIEDYLSFDKDGYGKHRSVEDVLDMYMSPDGDPIISQIKKKKLKNMLFGFSNIKDLRFYFQCDSLLITASTMGYYLAIYEVDDQHVIIGPTQAVFWKNKFKSKSLVDLKTVIDSVTNPCIRCK